MLRCRASAAAAPKRRLLRQPGEVGAGCSYSLCTLRERSTTLRSSSKLFWEIAPCARSPPRPSYSCALATPSRVQHGQTGLWEPSDCGPAAARAGPGDHQSPVLTRRGQARHLAAAGGAARRPAHLPSCDHLARRRRWAARLEEAAVPCAPRGLVGAPCKRTAASPGSAHPRELAPLRRGVPACIARVRTAKRAPLLQVRDLAGAGVIRR